MSRYPDSNINHLSHIALPFSPNNRHYGNQGDHPYASRRDSYKTDYGAYSRIEEDVYHLLFNLGLVKRKKYALTYNPDFDFMATSIINFIQNRTNYEPY